MRPASAALSAHSALPCSEAGWGGDTGCAPANSRMDVLPRANVSLPPRSLVRDEPFPPSAFIRVISFARFIPIYSKSHVHVTHVDAAWARGMARRIS